MDEVDGPIDATAGDGEWGFTDTEDAVRYLAEVRRLWALWMAALIVLMSAPGAGSVFLGLGILVLIIVVARPLQRRAARSVPYNTVPGRSRWVPLLGRPTARDRALRAFAYGAGPLEEALRLTGRNPVWLQVRKFVVAATVVAFVLVLFGLFLGWEETPA